LLGGGAHALPAWLRWSIALLSSFLLLFHLYVGVYGPPTNIVYLAVHLCVALALAFLFVPLRRRWDEPLNAWSVLDLAGVAICFAVLAYLLASIDTWQQRLVEMRVIDSVMAVALIGVVIEIVRRTVGWALIVLSACFVVHALFADRFPGVFYGPPVSVESLLQTLFIGDAGIFGIPVLVMAQYVVLFLLFGRLLQETGAGAFFTRLAFAVFGHRVGGPAKAAVVSSGLFGTASGSGVSNVLTTGAFTIPMMARLGYRPAFAGGVEASAAVGGAIMPPVMGAVAFMMAEFMGVSYGAIALAAVLPAVLYYFAIYCTVHLEAKKFGLRTLARQDLPRAWPLIARQGYLAAPLLLIIVLLVAGYSIVLVALVTSLGTILVSFIRPETRVSPARMADAIEATARTTTSLSATCACAGLIIGSIFATGLSFQVTQVVISLAADKLWLLVVVSGLIALVLGTGLTASAVYITMVATVIPILKAAGVSDMGAHMFAFYYGVVADITPPTALAAVAAAGIARANPMSTMVEASRIGVAAFIVPVTFVYSPALLMQGDVLTIALATLTAGLGLFALAVALAGHLSRPIGAARRVVFLIGAFCLIMADGASDLVGLVLVALACAPEFFKRATGYAPVAAAPAADDESLDELKRVLQFEPRRAQSPPDFARWSAWLVIGAVAALLGALGARHAHAQAPLGWLAGLALGALVLVAGLRVALRPVLSRMPSQPAAVL
jgi:TRAP transporter 4TM/12TM fusion protein